MGRLMRLGVCEQERLSHHVRRGRLLEGDRGSLYDVWDLGLLGNQSSQTLASGHT